MCLIVPYNKFLCFLCHFNDFYNFVFCRAAEERKLKELQQQQQQKYAAQAKKTPSVNVVGKSGDESNLAPWQLELQKR